MEVFKNFKRKCLFIYVLIYIICRDNYGHNRGEGYMMTRKGLEYRDRYPVSKSIGKSAVLKQGRMVNTGSSGKNQGTRRCFAPLFGIFERNLC